MHTARRHTCILTQTHTYTTYNTRNMKSSKFIYKLIEIPDNIEIDKIYTKNKWQSVQTWRCAIKGRLAVQLWGSQLPHGLPFSGQPTLGDRLFGPDMRQLWQHSKSGSGRRLKLGRGARVAGKVLSFDPGNIWLLKILKATCFVWFFYTCIFTYNKYTMYKFWLIINLKKVKVSELEENRDYLHVFRGINIFGNRTGKTLTLNERTDKCG